MEKRYDVWVEITANKEWILDAVKFEETMKKCRAVGMTGIILSVKDTTGFSLYPSQIAPHYSKYDKTFLPAYDYVKQCFSIIKNLGMKCYAAFDTFAAGNGKNPHPDMPGIKKDGFACEVYGLDTDGKPVIRKQSAADHLHTVGSIDDFGEIFLNPGNEEVQAYVLALLKEFVDTYHPDGIVLDRVRYVGLSTDFSEQSRKKWEAYSGISDERWPEDMYTIVQTKNGYQEKPGRYFGTFITWRMQIIHDFIVKVKQMLREYPDVEFCDYTGSWYPLYYQVGVNWADQTYAGNEFPWCDKAKLQQTAYAGEIDTLLSGCYYEDVTVSEAEKNEKPADWYSVEGAARLAEHVAGNATTIVDSLFLDQYRETPQKISQAIAMCMEHSAGCMLFDLSYLVKDNWWKYANAVEYSQMKPGDQADVAEICKEIFAPEYFVTPEKLRSHLFEDPEFDMSTSVCMRDVENHVLIGFSGVKLSGNQQLYPDTAWISICGVAKRYQHCGYGTLLLQKTLQQLREKGIHKVFLGQDFANFFSGIPAPNKQKCGFFQRIGFTLNGEDHYDLEGSLTDNAKIEEFDETPWHDICVTDCYHGEKEALLGFLYREFPGRWEYEAGTALQHGKAPEEIIMLWTPDRSELIGYCMLTVEKDARQQPNGRGGLGPIGIAKKIRGHHVGDYILHQSLCQLRKLGVETVNIDWTILKAFYGQFDFYAARTYRAAYMEL